MSYLNWHKALTNGSTQTPKPTLFLWVSLRSLYHKKLSGLGAGEPGVRHTMKPISFLLEECNKEIFWGMKANELKLIGEPDIRETPPKYELFWSGEKVLGGLKASVYAELFGEQRLRKLRIFTYDEKIDTTVEMQYNRIKNHMEKVY